MFLRSSTNVWIEFEMQFGINSNIRAFHSKMKAMRTHTNVRSKCAGCFVKIKTKACAVPGIKMGIDLELFQIGRNLQSRSDSYSQASFKRNAHKLRKLISCEKKQLCWLLNIPSYFNGIGLTFKYVCVCVYKTHTTQAMEEKIEIWIHLQCVLKLTVIYFHASQIELHFYR